MSESPDTIHGRMKEGAHLAGYGAARAMDNLKFLLEEERYKELSSGYKDVNEFLRDTERAFRLLKIDPAERKQIARLVKKLQPQASQRAIADMVGVDKATIGADLGTVERDRRGEISPPDTVKEPNNGEISPPQPWTVDPDYDPASPKKRGDDWYQASKSPVWGTPKWLFDLLDKEFGFTLDVCALPDNAKCEKFFSPEADGLKQQWEGVCWMNPPYGTTIKDWMSKAKESALNGTTVVCLVPARPDTNWWWDNCIGAEVRFIKGRLEFVGSTSAAPFPSAVVVMYPGLLEKQAKVVWWNIQNQ